MTNCHSLSLKCTTLSFHCCLDTCLSQVFLGKVRVWSELVCFVKAQQESACFASSGIDRIKPFGDVSFHPYFFMAVSQGPCLSQHWIPCTKSQPSISSSWARQAAPLLWFRCCCNFDHISLKPEKILHLEEVHQLDWTWLNNLAPFLHFRTVSLMASVKLFLPYKVAE